MWPLYIDMEPSPRGRHNKMACDYRLALEASLYIAAMERSYAAAVTHSGKR